MVSAKPHENEPGTDTGAVGTVGASGAVYPTSRHAPMGRAVLTAQGTALVRLSTRVQRQAPDHLLAEKLARDLFLRSGPVGNTLRSSIHCQSEKGTWIEWEVTIT